MRRNTQDMEVVDYERRFLQNEKTYAICEDKKLQTFFLIISHVYFLT